MIIVISEVLFYTFLIYDTYILEDNLFKFGQYKNSRDKKDTSFIKNNDNKFEKLSSHILAERYHPLFNEAVMLIIKNGLSNLGISFDRATYDYQKKAIIG